jgi:hypothetical protein
MRAPDDWLPGWASEPGSRDAYLPSHPGPRDAEMKPVFPEPGGGDARAGGPRQAAVVAGVQARAPAMG